MKRHFEQIFLTWLRLAAQVQLRKNNPLIIGVTGSAGKTSGVQAVELVLKHKYRVKATHKGNSETGIPFELLNIEVDTYVGVQWLEVAIKALWQVLTYWPKYDVLVVEMGIDSQDAPRNMEYHLRYLHPQIGIFLNVSSVHGENFRGKNIVQSIAQEKGKLLTHLPTSGLAVFTADQLEITSIAQRVVAKVARFSIDSDSTAELRLNKYEVALTGTSYTFTLYGEKHVLELPAQIHSKVAFGTFAAALLVGHELQVPISESLRTLAQEFKLLPGRMSLIEGKRDTVLIDSSYNSSLGATTGALHTLKTLEPKRRKVAIIGDMRELGTRSAVDHQSLAKALADTAQLIILIGPQTAQYVAPALVTLKFPSAKLHSFENAYDSLTSLDNLLQPHDLVLIKGSQNTIFLEIIVKHLMKQPEQAAKLLCRQTPYWESQRQLLKR
ncbi:MAG: UDP-N-acetylmuramoyl-tripeptide--D-alanyl-D-alanine ligase [bacterium]|nr:UDP-N-acetylmuramoyl-tripeptide--D-alanyl-D-alanine ligase [bacterium]